MVNSGAQVKTGAWDPEEDDLLYYWQSKVGNKWSEVAKHIPGRTGQQCAQRWRHKVNPNIRRDKWTPEEDAKLIELVKTFGVGRWAEIARNCDGRTDQQCMGRWRRHLDPNIKRDSWSPEEDAKLRQLHAQYGTSWSRISKCLKGRTSQQCRARWHQINNGRGCNSKSAVFSGAVNGSTAVEGGGRRVGASGKRKPARRRRSYSDSDEDEPEDDEDEYDDDFEQEQRMDEQEQQQQQYELHGSHHDIMSAACEVPYTLEMPIHPAAVGVQMQQHYWNTAWDTAAVGSDKPISHGDIAYDADQHVVGSAEDEASDDDYVATTRSRYRNTHQWTDGKHSSSRSRLKPSSTRAVSTAQQHEESAWLHGSAQLLSSPAKCLQSPQRQQRSTMVDKGDLDEEETAGAETLLQMAHLLQRESCEFEPPSLRRSDFITASTPPKRAVEHRPEVRNSDELSPSPFKRARSSRGMPVVPGPEPGSSRGPACAASRSAVPKDKVRVPRGDDCQPPNAGQLRGTEGCRQDDKDDSYMVSEIHDQGTEEPDDDADALGSGLGDSGFDHPLPDPARPSNASSLTVVGNTAASFLSPPPITRAQASSSSRWMGGMVTPRQPTAYHNLMNLLGSPSFDRMPGYASPASAGKTQPSAATLAALQSPQPSCVHEPFWTPFTGLVKDGVLTRGTSDTPDLASGGKGRSGADLFSPVRRSGSTGNKTLARRSLLAGPAPAPAEGIRSADIASSSRSQSLSSCVEDAAAPDMGAGSGDAEAGPSPACRLQQPVQQLHHRVVRRLDQHEAWGGSTRSSPSKMRSPRKARQTGFSLFSPIKKQPVPLFDDSTSNFKVGSTPGKPSVPVVNLTITPLSNTLPSNLEAHDDPPGTAETSSPAALAAAAADPVPGSSPSSLDMADRPMFRHSAAARRLLSPVRSHLVQKQLKQQQQQQRMKQERIQEQTTPVGAQQQQVVSAAEPDMVQRASVASDIAQTDLAAIEKLDSGPLGRAENGTDTPVQSQQQCSVTSCSGTPSTPAGQRPFKSKEGEPSPDDFVTPQQRPRPSWPLAPLHKDCLLAAAARSLADAGAVSVAGREPSAKPTGGNAGASKYISSPCDAEEADACGSAPGSADSNKLLSPEGLMDSPLQIAQQQLQSPSQWHQGMVMLMQNLQQTPLQTRSQGDDSAANCDGKGPKEMGVVKAGSRALRRLQAELERGGSAAAIHSATSASVQHGVACSKPANDAPPAQMPLVASAAPQADCAVDKANAPTITVTTAQEHPPTSVSLTPAVVSCSKSDVLVMQGPNSAAVAWPVQQRPDGGLVVTTAAPCGEIAAATVLQLTPPAVSAAGRPVVDQKPSTQDSAQPPGSTPNATQTATAAVPVRTSLSGITSRRVSVVSIQPVAMLVNRTQQATVSARQPMLQALQQPSKSATPFGGALTLPEKFVDSHAVRSRLHALIDGV